MRIALVHMRHAQTGGTERYLNHLASHLAECGHGVHIVCRRHEDAPHPGVNFERLHSLSLGRTWRQWTFARDVERHVRAQDYDVVYGLGRTWTHDVIRLGGGLHATYLDRVRSLADGPERRGLLRGPKNRMTLHIEGRALAPGAYRRVVTNSLMVERDLVEKMKVPADCVVTIYNGVDLERFHPRHRTEAGAKLRRSLGLEQNPVVLFLGTGYGRKGLDLVLDAFPSLLAQQPKARLMVVGYDSGQAHYEGQARALGISDQVRFLGGRRDPEVCFGAADLYVLPTRYDPFANSTLEALASGLPVITSSGNGGGELIAQRIEGSVVEVDPGTTTATQDLALELVHWCDSERLEQGALAARRLAEAHPISQKMEATERVLMEAAAEKRDRQSEGNQP